MPKRFDSGGFKIRLNVKFEFKKGAIYSPKCKILKRANRNLPLQ
ncbi:hypothetical protein [Moraxella lacunata]